MAKVLNLGLGSLHFSYGDLHLYFNHVDQAREQLTRKPSRVRPLLILADLVTDLFEFTADDIELISYTPQPAIPAPVAV